MTDGEKPRVTILLPAFNEASILREHLEEVEAFTRKHADEFDWEVVIVNDGSLDETGEIADEFAAGREAFRVVHHVTNRGLGQAMRTGFAAATGDYVVTLDIDLSYSVDHITRLLAELRRTGVDVALASPYMKGGKLLSVPWLRRTLSILANKFLRLFTPGNLSTLTSMTRAYRSEFIRALNTRSMDMSIMPEIIYKSMILRATMVEVPATLDWTRQRKSSRESSTRILSHVAGTILSSFVLRPFAYLVVPGTLLLIFSLYVNFWMVAHFFEVLLAGSTGPDSFMTPSRAISIAYQNYPHTFIVGLLSLMLSIQLIGLGALALLGKRYFEELFHFQTSIQAKIDDIRKDDSQAVDSQ